MAVAQIVIFIVSTVLVVSESHYVTHFRKCGSRDSECLRSYFQSVIYAAASNGIRELDIPVFDPIVIREYSSSVPGWLDLEMVEGVGNGGRSCVLNKFGLSFEKRYGSVEITCDVSVNGHYKAYSNSSLIRNLLDGDTIYGDGNGGIKIDKLKMAYDFNFRVEKRGHDYFLNCNFENSKYSIDILDGVTFSADNLYLGKWEASHTIISVMNQYWKMILEATGLPVMDGIFRFLFSFTQRYLYSVPVSSYIYEDLAAYVVY